MIKVLKFGGTSMGSAENMAEVAGIIRDEQATVVVLSAMSGTTDGLSRICMLAAEKVNTDEIKNIISVLKQKYTACAEELGIISIPDVKTTIDDTFGLITTEAEIYSGELSERTILAQGELLTTYVFSVYVNNNGGQARLLHAPSFIYRNGTAGVDEKQLHALVGEAGDVDFFITQGFICSDPEGQLSNLGRGGSDYTAALIGATLDAGEVQVWTDIDGIHNNDPRYVENTFPIRRMHFDEAAELAYFGAKILHPSTIQPCKDKGIPVLLKDTMDPGAKGTVITNCDDHTAVYRAVAAKDGITVVRIYSARMLLAYGFLRKVFEVFEKYETPIDMITTSEVAVSLTIDDDRRLPQIINELQEYGNVETEKNNSIICVVGKLDHSEKRRALEILDAVGDVPLKMISYGASHRSIAFLADTAHKITILNNLNDKLFPHHAEQND